MMDKTNSIMVLNIAKYYKRFANLRSLCGYYIFEWCFHDELARKVINEAYCCTSAYVMCCKILQLWLCII